MEDWSATVVKRVASHSFDSSHHIMSGAPSLVAHVRDLMCARWQAVNFSFGPSWQAPC